jgi:transcription antitermination factor NusG
VNDEVVRALQAAATDDVVIVPRRTLRPGDVVQIEDGPLRGLQGILEREVSASERVVILLQIISQGARVEAPIDAVSALQ